MCFIRKRLVTIDFFNKELTVYSEPKKKYFRASRKK
ncbi:hypothetical protein ZPR_1970 [Zunongwangia profunda SM-A87]|uniref:Uncharacterized protein n=1 Tax=Zunongwangia profunda (strain DSM 18752 / CCTCC AB 206139 / SM-A87) TaxID=655815 RepID=D5B9Z7_ZUNPS|nr:hypothetical protein ZPR_1970 [Zunongwangia profunda SM-A87]